MAFSKEGAVAGAGTGATVGGPLGAVIGGVAGGFLLGGSKKKKLKVPPEILRSLAALEKTALEAESATAPTRRIAALSKLEELSVQLSEQFARSDIPPELQTAISETIKTATTPVDVTQVPELAALIEQTERFGQKESTRLAQSIQIRGGSASTGGRNVLGQKLQDIQSNILATLAPFASTLRQLKEQAVSRLADLSSQKTGLELTKIGVAGEAGSMMRNIQQRINDALFAQQTEQQRLKFEVAPGIRSRILGAPSDLITVTGGEPSTFSQFSPLIEKLAAAFINRPKTTPGVTPGVPLGLPGGQSFTKGTGVPQGLDFSQIATAAQGFLK